MGHGDEQLITIIGRGHSGTSALSQTLIRSGVFLGHDLNRHWDTVPPDKMYEACWLIAKHVRWTGGLSWDFDRLHTMPIDPEFEDLVREYLTPILGSTERRKGWKLPETTLAFPWIARMFPNVRYLHIVRDPRDSLLKRHLTDDLSLCEIDWPETDDELAQRVASWKYQHELIKATPRPRHFISIRYEDLVRDQGATIERLEAFLGFPLARIEMDESRVGQWKHDRRLLDYVQPLADDMRELGYDDRTGPAAALT